MFRSATGEIDGGGKKRKEKKNQQARNVFWRVSERIGNIPIII